MITLTHHYRPKTASVTDYLVYHICFPLIAELEKKYNFVHSSSAISTKQLKIWGPGANQWESEPYIIVNFI